MGNALALIGENIRQTRESLGLSQSDLAKKSGLTVQSISRIETGKSNPRWANLDTIAEALGVSIDRLFGIYPDDRVKALSSALEFLAKFQGLSRPCQMVVLALVFDDEAYLDGLSPADAHSAQSLLLKCEKLS